MGDTVHAAKEGVFESRQLSSGFNDVLRDCGLYPCSCISLGKNTW